LFRILQARPHNWLCLASITLPKPSAFQAASFERGYGRWFVLPCGSHSPPNATYSSANSSPQGRKTPGAASRNQARSAGLPRFLWETCGFFRRTAAPPEPGTTSRKNNLCAEEVRGVSRGTRQQNHPAPEPGEKSWLNRTIGFVSVFGRGRQHCRKV